MKDRIPNTKIAERLLTRPEGATMKEIRDATGSDQYVVLAKLKNRHYAIREVKEGNATRYFAHSPAVRSFEVTVTSKGQATIPVELRERLGVRAGGKLRFDLEAEDRVVMRPVDLSVGRLFGVLGKPKRSLAVEEMDEAVRRAVIEKHGRRVR
jgi:AbrB family looped-hinge helix DNA binding protein